MRLPKMLVHSPYDGSQFVLRSSVVRPLPESVRLANSYGNHQYLTSMLCSDLIITVSLCQMNCVEEPDRPGGAGI